MKRKISPILTGMIIGSLGTVGVGAVGIVSADGLQMSLSNVKLLINGVDKTNGGTFYNGQANVPVAVSYNNTTYVPLRYLSQALGLQVGFDQTSQTITVGNGSTNSGGSSLQPTQTFVPPGRSGLGSISVLSSDIFTGTDTDTLEVKLAYQNTDTNEWNFGNLNVSIQGTDGSTYSATSNLPQNTEATVDPKTTRVVTYTASVPKGSVVNNFKLLIQNYDFTQQPAAITTVANYGLSTAGFGLTTGSAGQATTFTASPYSLTLNAIDNAGYSNGNQSYDVSYSVTKPSSDESYPDDGDIEFDLMSGSRLVSNVKYAMDSSSSLATLPSGNATLTFPNVSWLSSDTSAPVIDIYSYINGSKRLIGTYTMPTQGPSTQTTVNLGQTGSTPVPSLSVGQSFTPSDNQNSKISLISSDLYTGVTTDLLVVKVTYQNNGLEPWNISNYGVNFERTDASVYAGTSNGPTNDTIEAKSTQVVTYYTNVPKGSKTSDFLAYLNEQVSQQPLVLNQTAKYKLADSISQASTYNISDTATFNLAPYTLTMNDAANMGYTRNTQVQTYRYNVTVTPNGNITNNDDGDVEFDLVDAEGRLISTLKYTMGTSANSSLPQLTSGDLLLNFNNVNWNYYAGPLTMNVYATMNNAKKLMGTYQMP